MTTGSNVPAAISAAPTGAHICFASGVYLLGELHPLANQTLDGQGVAVLDGGGIRGRAIANNSAVDGVTIRGFEVRNYVNLYGPESGAIGAYTGSNWTVTGNHVHNNAASGIQIGYPLTVTGNVVSNNVVDHNGCGGIMSGQGGGTVVSGNDVEYNGTGPFDLDAFSCGIGGLRIEILNNAHGGNGQSRTWAVRVLNNIFTNNGLSSTNRIMYGASIEIASSNHVEVANNTIDGGAHAIVMDQQVRSDFAWDLTINNISVHDNDIRLRDSGEGAGCWECSNIGRVGFYGAGPVAAPAVTYASNRYYFDDAMHQHFSLPATSGTPYNLATWAQWRAAGYDASSTLSASGAFP